jgi:hypothetical protein
MAGGMQSNTCSYFFECAEVGRHPNQPFSKMDDGGKKEAGMEKSLYEN